MKLLISIVTDTDHQTEEAETSFGNSPFKDDPVISSHLPPGFRFQACLKGDEVKSCRRLSWARGPYNREGKAFKSVQLSTQIMFLFHV